MTLVVENRKGVSKNIKELYNKICSDKGDFLTTTQGLNQIMIITNSFHKETIERIFIKKEIRRKVENLSGITIDIPKGSIETPGFIYLISKSLAWNNITIVGLVSTFDELTLVVKEEDSTLTFDILRKLLRRNS
tara:strand:- start:83 stop:484 length:402 start_codon:yes stop_codon:yes gene_type:complete